MNLPHLRKDYTLAGLRRTDLAADPIVQFRTWFEEALKAEVPEPNAMTLATADEHGHPDARIVLLKGLDERGFHFFTNYESAKARELVGNPHAALVFHWVTMERQVRVRGRVERLTAADTEAYFKTRPRGSRLGAWASHQSRVIADREVLETELAELEKRFPGDEIPVPPFWGGFGLRPEVVEFWQGRSSRLHDRFRYQRGSGNDWAIDRLSP